ncbi:unnamed protein product [Schistosoma margrebowiei]|uniref:Uncharacterized protein n=1 Tax=Schistosoma margrebowiei TaxID=48269 RepID=A0A183MFY6_9TREM|nr:unnamed protein product [Schistosoma margrebowiei]
MYLYLRVDVHPGTRTQYHSLQSPVINLNGKIQAKQY